MSLKRILLASFWHSITTFLQILFNEHTTEVYSLIGYTQISEENLQNISTPVGQLIVWRVWFGLSPRRKSHLRSLLAFGT